MTDFGDWANLKIHEILGYVDSANTLVGKLAQEAFGPEGCPGDAREIIMVARNLEKILDIILDWCMDIRRIKADVPLAKVLDILAKVPTQMIDEMISFPKRALEKIHEALPLIHDKRPCPLELTMVFEALFIDEFNHALEECTNYYLGKT
ncbi:hypothetical protein AGMMS50293_28620 [Spirochaetia bacterium]|nr:hypothetical protein AGMMS50293_28620 [Spirochaetia bacterium]